MGRGTRDVALADVVTAPTMVPCFGAAGFFCSGGWYAGILMLMCVVLDIASTKSSACTFDWRCRSELGGWSRVTENTKKSGQLELRIQKSAKVRTVRVKQMENTKS